MIPESIDVSRMFSRSICGYANHSGAQQRIAQSLSALLPEPEAVCGPLLEVGCGTGHLTAFIANRYPTQLKILSDISRSMLSSLTGTPCSKVQCDVTALPFLPEFSLVVSSSVLHWAQSLEQAFHAIAQILSTRGSLVCAVMIHGTCHELHSVRSLVVPSKKPRRKLPTETECRSACQAAGFQIQQSSLLSLTENYPSAESAVRSLHEAGLTGGALSRGDLPIMRGELHEIYKEYERQFMVSAAVPVSFCAVLIRACKIV